ncbi:MAG TPA: hypothetical protein VFA80_15475 [Xanthobacteraceae bacterium]|nr:hypothetical protein [Xanthobacteraceae bacterium]
MQEIAEFRGYAEDCRRIARSTNDPEHKRRLMEMATVWDLLADEREERPGGGKRASDG